MRWLCKLNLVQLTTSSTEVHCTLVNLSHHSVPPHLQLVLLPTVYNHHVLLQPQGAPNTNLVTEGEVGVDDLLPHDCNGTSLLRF